MMRKIPRSYSWAAFALLAVLSLFTGSRFWMLSFYYPMMIAFAILAMGVGALLLMTSKVRWRTAGIVVLGLLIGQWWFTEQAILTLGFAISGFSP
ncbi:MAG: hypothetical protein H0X13_18125 [Ramlibacter sp.]|nr:hypothetical protein [Ramlibacter sp.]